MVRSVAPPDSGPHEWLLQAHLKFCVSLALAGEYDLRGSGGERGTVATNRDRRADRLYAARITVVAVVAALVVTALVYGTVLAL